MRVSSRIRFSRELEHKTALLKNDVARSLEAYGLEYMKESKPFFFKKIMLQGGLQACGLKGQITERY